MRSATCARSSTRSAPCNIAEGFDRSNREFLRYVTIALGSLRETNTHLGEALTRKYVTPEEHAHLRTLTKRAIRAGEGLKAYLESFDGTTRVDRHALSAHSEDRSCSRMGRPAA